MTDSPQRGLNILLAGCGQLGQRLGQQLIKQGDQVIGIKRYQQILDFPLWLADLTDPQALSEREPNIDVIIFTVTPNARNEMAYRLVYEQALMTVLNFARRHDPQPLVILVSSTAVYGQQNGEWVDEASTTVPTTYSGKWVLYGEQCIQQLDNPLSLRFSGIYSHQRRWLIRTALSGKAIQQSPPIWTNRIHEDDCVGILSFLINRYRNHKPLDNLYLASDNQPCPRDEVIAFICQTLGKPLPAIDNHQTIDCNKRCDNHKIKALGYSFKYSDYRLGYADILRA